MPVKRSQSAARVLSVLEAVAAQQPIGVRALARLLECDKSAVQRALMTLADEGWIRATIEAPVRWEVSARIFAVAQLAYGGNDLRQRARRTLERLRDETGETIMLALPDLHNFVIADVVESRQVLRMAPYVGTKVSVQNTATGRAMLPFMTEGEQLALLGQQPSREMREMFALTREQGFAVSDGEINPGATNLAAPIFEFNGQPVGAIVLTAPRQRLALLDHDELGRQLARAAQELSRGRPAVAVAAS